MPSPGCTRRRSRRPSDAGAVRSLAETLHAWEQWEAAHQAYARCQALAPGGVECHYLDAVVLQRLALFDDAARQFKQAVSLESGYLPARVGLAETTVRSWSARREPSIVRGARRRTGVPRRQRSSASAGSTPRRAITTGRSRTSIAPSRSFLSSAPPITRSRSRIARSGAPRTPSGPWRGTRSSVPGGRHSKILCETRS